MSKKKPPRVALVSYIKSEGILEVLIGNKLYVQSGIGQYICEKLLFYINKGWYGRALKPIRDWQFRRADTKTYRHFEDN